MNIHIIWYLLSSDTMNAEIYLQMKKKQRASKTPFIVLYLCLIVASDSTRFKTIDLQTVHITLLVLHGERFEEETRGIKKS